MNPMMTGQLLSAIQHTSGGDSDEGGGGGGAGPGSGALNLFMLHGILDGTVSDKISELMNQSNFFKIFTFGLTSMDTDKGLFGQINLLGGDLFQGFKLPSPTPVIPLENLHFSRKQ